MTNKKEKTENNQDQENIMELKDEVKDKEGVGNNNNQVDEAEKVSEAKIKELEDKLSESKDQLIRLVAEMDNIKKRTQKQIEDSLKFAVTDFAKDLLNVLDNLYRATDFVTDEHKNSSPIVKSIIEGVELTKSELLKTFDRNGIKRIFPVNEKFDHNLHQAISQIDSDKESGVIIEVMQAGYVINDRLLRPAMVIIAK